MQVADESMSRLSGETKALIIISEYRLRRLPMIEISRILDTLVVSDLERVGIIELIRRQAPGMGLSDGDTHQLIAGLENASGTARDTQKTQAHAGPGKTIRVHRFDAPEPGSRKSADTFRVQRRDPNQTQKVAGAHYGDPLRSGAGAFAAPAQGASSAPTSGGKPRILIADDDTRIRMVFRKRLEDNGYRVTEVSDGTAAWESLQNESFDAAILDMKMPGLHGLEVLAKLTSAGATVPVVICSAYEQLQEEFVVATYPTLRFLVKPVPMDKLLETINELTSAKA